MMFKHFYIILGFVLTGCTTQIELDQPLYESKIVVDGYIESKGFAHVYLTKSSPFLTEYDSASILASFLNTASVTLTCSNGESEILTLFRQNTFFPPFVYKSIRMKGIAGERYTLTVKTGGRTLTAQTSIPEPPAPSNLIMKQKTDSSGLLTFQISNATDTTSYVYIQYKSIKADQNFHPAGVPVYKMEATISSTNINVIRCDENNLFLINPRKGPYSWWPKGMFSLKDTVLVKIGIVDVASYQVLKSLFADEAIRNNPFSFNSAGIQSNIKGGIGRWTGIGMAPIQLYINSLPVLF